jgi:nicotinamide-nucleotide amidase
MNDDLRALAERVGGRLRARGETVAIAESSAGGLISAALLAVPGASAYFRGGGVVYTGDAKGLFLKLSKSTLTKPRAATPEHSMVLARGVRERLGATWGLGETGAAGPTGNRYGDPAGHTCVGVAGPVELTETLQTGATDRYRNMEAFAVAGLRCLENALARTPS